MQKKTKPILKTPVSYYGGQQKILKDIMPLIPAHHLYNEPFAGGAALLFAKEPVEINVINDLNGEIINFYRTAVSDFDALSKEIKKTLHSREQVVVAKFIYEHPDYFSNVQRAWAVWAMSKLCFMSNFANSFSFSRKKNSLATRIESGKNIFTKELRTLLEKCTIEHDDAFNVIRRYDTPDTFHFIDPPFVNFSMGHYNGMFSETHLNQLLELMTFLQGKFMLTMYPDETIHRYARANGWTIHKIEKNISVGKAIRRKQEVWMVINYVLPEK